MKILLTRDQESTLWNLQQTLTVPNHGTYLYSPYFLKDLGAGEYERMRYEDLPGEVKDQLLANQGIKLPIDERTAECNGDNCRY